MNLQMIGSFWAQRYWQRTKRIWLAGLMAMLSSAAVAQGMSQPNIVYVLFDDAGFSDFGAYGSEIRTPNIDAIARAGVRFNNFHTASTCEASRAMLHSGVDSHLAGQGTLSVVISDRQRGKPGYEGFLSDQAHSLGSLMRDGGYATYFAGKWNLGKGLERAPGTRGWDRYVGLEQTGADNYEAKVYAPFDTEAVWWQDGKRLELPKDFYSSRYYVDRLIANIDEGRQSAKSKDKPFFAMLSLQAVHSPQQTPKEDYTSYLPIYEAGWDAIRQKRYQRQVEMGLIKAGLKLPVAPTRREWSALSDEERRYEAKEMAIYAGMLERADKEIGRLRAHLASIGKLDNTVFVVMSDNGADPYDLSEINGAFKLWHRLNRDNSYDNLGERNSYVHYGPGWAEVSNTPLAFFKGTSFEGGMRVPFVVSHPKRLKGDRIADTFVYVTDVLPTLLEVAGIPVPGETYQGKALHKPSGRSLLPYLEGTSTSVRQPGEAIGYECTGSEAMFKDGYKLLRNKGIWFAPGWQLYNTLEDPTESNDLAAAQPERVKDMLAEMDTYNKRNGVVEPEPGYDPIAQLLTNNWHTLLRHFALPLTGVAVLALGVVLLLVRARRRRQTA
jgi:arylsulfatase A-like enzyme